MPEAELVGKYMIRPVLTLERVFLPHVLPPPLIAAIDIAARPEV